MKMQKLGGYASIVLTLVSIVSYLIIISIPGLSIYDPAKMMAAYQVAPMSFLAVYFLGVLSCILILLIALALQARMNDNAPYLMRLVVIAASIYAALMLTTEISGLYRNMILAPTKDFSAIRAFLVLHACLSYSAALAWGLGLLLIGWAALRTRALSRILGCIVLAYGILEVLGGQSGNIIIILLSSIAYVWLGVALLRNPKPIPVRT
jgi:hypothetical protein